MKKESHAKIVERLRQSCLIGLAGMTAVLGIAGYATGQWIPVTLILPFGMALILLWYIDSRMSHLMAEISDAIDDSRRKDP